MFIKFCSINHHFQTFNVPNFGLRGQAVAQSLCFHSSTLNSSFTWSITSIVLPYGFSFLIHILWYSNVLSDILRVLGTPCCEYRFWQFRKKQFHMILISFDRLSTSSSDTKRSLKVLLLIFIAILSKQIFVSCFKLILIRFCFQMLNVLHKIQQYKQRKLLHTKKKSNFLVY